VSLVGLLGGRGRFLVVKDLTFGRLELGEVVFSRCIELRYF